MARPQHLSDDYRAKDQYALSQRHRQWGAELHATDIDYLVENRYGQPVAIIEYKKNDTPCTSNQRRTLQTLADMARIPFFIVNYHINYADGWTFTVQHKTWDQPVTVPEPAFVDWLRELRT